MKLTSLLLLFTIIFCSSCKDKKKLEQIVESIENPAVLNSQTPKLFSNGKELYMSWITQEDSQDHLNFSVLKNTSWSKPHTILSGHDWFTNWADFPAISENEGSILTNILQKSAPDTYTYDIKLNYKNSDSANWKKDFILHSDGTKSEHGFVSIVPSFDANEFFITWLDGRNTIANQDNTHAMEHHSGRGAMTLRGANINGFGNIINSKVLDAKVCDCCQTSATITRNGPVVVYRDRSDAEVRDISIVRQVNDIWTAPKTVFNDNWKIAGCPVNGPSVDALGNNLAVAWFTAVNEMPKVQVAFSSTGGESFETPIQINTKETLGRVDVIMLNETQAIVSWMERDPDDTAYIMLAKVSASGTINTPIIVSKTNGSRATGFSQIEFLDGYIYAAMTLINKDKISQIKTARILVDRL